MTKFRVLKALALWFTAGVMTGITVFNFILHL